MRCIFLLFAVYTFSLRAQDKLFFINGSVKKGIIVSVARDVVYFKATDTSATEKIKRSDLVMSENYNGVRFIFFTEQQKKDSVVASEFPAIKKNNFGAQPLAIFVGRATLVYEHLTDDGKIGFVVPLSLTFDPFGKLYRLNYASNQKPVSRVAGVNFIVGADVNFYVGKHPFSRFFIGPRFRYGTDQFLRGTEGVTLQTQTGWRFGDPGKALTQHFSLGFGIANILTSSTWLQPKQYYAWFSVNYRVGFSW